MVRLIPVSDTFRGLTLSADSVAGAAGAITAAQFLQRYVGEVPWVHLDIAGSSHKLVRKDPREPPFTIGFGVRLLNQWLADHC